MDWGWPWHAIAVVRCADKVTVRHARICVLQLDSACQNNPATVAAQCDGAVDVRKARRCVGAGAMLHACRKWVEEKARNSVLESKLVNTATYELIVRTGNVKGAATDARVYIELYGPDAMTPGALLGTNRPASPATTAAGAACSSSSPGGSPGAGGS